MLVPMANVRIENTLLRVSG